MKKKIAILGVASALVAVVLAACSDQLEQDVNGVSSIETFYATDDDAQLAIVATYDMLTADNLFDWASPTLIKTLPSDEGTAGGGGSTDQPRYQALDNFTWDSANPAVQATWQVNYYGIFRANMIIENLEPENDLRKRIIGEAKALRAYFYMELVTQFGDIPLILKGLEPTEFNQSRVAKAQIYEQIEADLTDAVSVLPHKSEYSAADQFRASKGTANTLLGKVLLYQGEYADAAAAFEKVTGYSLVENYADVFKDSEEFGSESVLEASFSSKVPYDWNYPWGTRFENNLHVQLMGARAGSTPELGLIAGWGFNYPSEKLWDAFNDMGDTERRDATMFSEAQYLTYKSTDPDFDGSTWWDYNRYFRLKYGSFDAETNQDGAPKELNYGTNWRLIRYSDVLLLKAEAYAMDNQPGPAQEALNEVRRRAGLADITPTGNALMAAIRQERFVELAFEGHRYFDLIRWGRSVAEAELGVQVSPTFTGGDPAHYGDNFDFDKHQVFPIPISDIAAATNMTQNDGY
ncbi:MAG: RagB/SusD family nutrient uptake outer membrane protein [Reichenbachiella sp.]|uniref:RagB/SusD family nutrient uptake outer membrane protein n=1 Tax=Reichenbachiella sp. TaxID=2184521 RepID=UPI00326316DB